MTPAEFDRRLAAALERLPDEWGPRIARAAAEGEEAVARELHFAIESVLAEAELRHVH